VPRLENLTFALRHSCYSCSPADLLAFAIFFQNPFHARREFMLDVSHFELIWKPQSPASPAGVVNVASVIQGYFLEITNLEDREYLYTVEFVAAAVSDPNRSLAGNTLVFVDTPGTNNAPGVLNGSITSTVFSPSTGSIRIPAKGTALIAVLPSAFGPTPADMTPLAAPTFEVRGYVRLRLPAVFQPTPGSFFGRFVAQASAPVKVLLTPQNRATYFTASNVISDQTQASLPLASGNALNFVDPENGLFVATIPGQLSADLIGNRLIEGLDPQTISALFGLMADEATDLKDLNAQLKEAGIGLAVERRAAKV
jgi:hypothetical protein